MNILNVVDMDHFIIDSIRILILISAFENKKSKSFKLTENKIKLYDYYLRFPSTMLEDKPAKVRFKNNFDEYYSFFHWKPDVIRYRKVINYLTAKDLIRLEFEKNGIFYLVTEKGTELINSMQSKYKNDLCEIALIIVKYISKISDKKLEEEILAKTNLLKRVLEV